MRFLKWILWLVFVPVVGQNYDKEQKEEKITYESGRLSVLGTNLVNDKGEKVVLQGVSLGWHNWWPRFYNASVVRRLKLDWNVTVVRAAMGVEPQGAYLTNSERAIKKVTTVVDAAIKNKIHVIIDWHSHGLHTKEAKLFFSQIAERYKDTPYVLYEIFNEPVDYSWEEIKAYSEEVIAAIRAVDKQNIILVGTPRWAQDVDLVADNPIVGYDNIMYTLHFYAATHKKELRVRADYALSKGLPIFVSECASMEATGDGEINFEEWREWRNWMRKNDISWVAWSISDKDETCSMISHKASSKGKWKKNTDIKEWGRLIKQELLNK